MTPSIPRARAFYLRGVPDPVFGMFHPAALEGAPKTAVLLCPPWGWDEVASYRSRRTWAEHLAENGHPTLRIDFPGAGDSTGSAGDPGRLEVWARTIVAASTWLADSSGSDRVAAIGLGLGGLVATKALEDGAPIDDLGLWAAPSLGRALIREQRAFGRLQSSHYGPGVEADDALPEGWVEVGGFVQSAETTAAIERLDLRQIDPAGLQRALLLGRDGIPVDAGLQAHLENAGVEVTVAPGNGWEAMCFHPERYQPPVEVMGRVSAWLAMAPPPAAPRLSMGASHRPSRVDDHLELLADGAQILETPIGPGDLSGGSFGVLAERVDLPRADLCAVFLNAGAIRRIGPNRMWVEAGRRWAARGVPTFRVDVEGIGDADGDGAMYADVGRFYTPDRGGQVTSILDALEARGVASRFVLIGLCAGAFSAFHAAADDDRVIAALAVNPRILVWDPGLLARREAHLVKRVLAADSWKRILRGETTPATVLAIGRTAAAQASQAVIQAPSRFRDRRQVDQYTAELERILDRQRAKGTRVVLAFSGDEPVYDELDAGGFLARPGSWPDLVVTHLPGSDHTLRPVVAQRAFHDTLDHELDRLGRDEAASRR